MGPMTVDIEDFSILSETWSGTTAASSNLLRPFRHVYEAQPQLIDNSKVGVHYITLSHDQIAYHLSQDDLCNAFESLQGSIFGDETETPCIDQFLFENPQNSKFQPSNEDLMDWDLTVCDSDGPGTIDSDHFPMEVSAAAFEVPDFVMEDTSPAVPISEYSSLLGALEYSASVVPLSSVHFPTLDSLIKSGLLGWHSVTKSAQRILHTDIINDVFFDATEIYFRDILVEALQREKISTEEGNFIIYTHLHPFTFTHIIIFKVTQLLM